MRKPQFIVIVACASIAASAAAQNSLPGLENFTLERPQPTATPTVTPTLATPAPTPTPVPTASPTPPPSPTPTPTAAQSPRSTATPTPRATEQPRPVNTPAAAPTPAETAAAIATPTAVPEPTAAPLDNAIPAEPAAADAPVPTPTRWGLWAALAALLLAGIGAFLWWQRRPIDAADPERITEPDRTASTTDGPAHPPAPAPVPPLPPVAPVPPPPALPGGLITSSLKRDAGGGLVTSSLKPDLRIALTPRRGGVDTLRATLEYEIQVGNAGRGTARAVAVETWLIGAGHQTASDLARLFSSPAGEPLLAPFELAPSAAIDLAGVAAVPREMLATITVGDRRMFVPIMAVRASYLDGRGTPQALTTAFLVGIERAGQDRLAPLPLDRGGGMHDRLAARPFNG